MNCGIFACVLKLFCNRLFMPYAELMNEKHEVVKRISTEPTGWNETYRKLFDQTDISGWELFLTGSYNNFKNRFWRAMKRNDAYLIIARDIIRKGEKGMDDKGRTHVVYISNANTDQQREHKIRAPPDGWGVPTDECIIVNGVMVPVIPGTLIPFNTVESKRNAIKIARKFGLPRESVCYFQMSEFDKGDYFAGFGFGYDPNYNSFYTAIDFPVLDKGDEYVSSLPTYTAKENDQTPLLTLTIPQNTIQQQARILQFHR